jgi:hypothetical protein
MRSVNCLPGKRTCCKHKQTESLVFDEVSSNSAESLSPVFKMAIKQSDYSPEQQLAILEQTRLVKELNSFKGVKEALNELINKHKAEEDPVKREELKALYKKQSADLNVRVETFKREKRELSSLKFCAY